MERFYDIHCHIFNVSHIPMKTILTRNGFKLEIFLRDLPTIKKDDLIRKYIDTCEKKVIEILEQMVKEIRECEYTKDKEIVLTPLLLYFQNEDYIKNIKDQIRDIKAAIYKFLSKNDGISIYPFVGVDPSNQDALELTKSNVVPATVAKNGDFIGVKIYPPLNCNLGDKSSVANIHAFFKYCAENSIPITTHCSGGGCISKNINKKKAKDFSSPLRWKNILSCYNGLKVNFAHFGDFEKSWIENITLLMRDTNSNIYSDISYSIIKKDLLTKARFKKLKELLNTEVVKDRILFGSDYYMSLMECFSYKELLDNIRNEIGDVALRHISENNPAEFLGFSREGENKKKGNSISKKIELETEDKNILFLETIRLNNGDCSSNG